MPLRRSKALMQYRAWENQGFFLHCGLRRIMVVSIETDRASGYYITDVPYRQFLVLISHSILLIA